MPYRNRPRPPNMRDIFKLTSSDDSIQTFQVDQELLRDCLAASEDGSGEDGKEDGERCGASGSVVVACDVSGEYGGTQVAADPPAGEEPTGGNVLEPGGVQTQPELMLANGSAVQGAKGISSSDRGTVRGAKGALPAEPEEAVVDGDALRGAKGALPAEPGAHAVHRSAVRGAKGAPQRRPLEAATRSEGSEQLGVQGAKTDGSADPSTDPLLDWRVAGKRRFEAAWPMPRGPVLILSGFHGSEFCREGRTPRVQGAKRTDAMGLGSRGLLDRNEEESLEAPRDTTLEVEGGDLDEDNLLLCLKDAKNSDVCKRRRMECDGPFGLIVGGDNRNLILSQLDAHSLARCIDLSRDCAAMVLNVAFWRLKLVVWENPSWACYVTGCNGGGDYVPSRMDTDFREGRTSPSLGLPFQEQYSCVLAKDGDWLTWWRGTYTVKESFNHLASGEEQQTAEWKRWRLPPVRIVHTAPKSPRC